MVSAIATALAVLLVFLLALYLFDRFRPGEAPRGPERFAALERRSRATCAECDDPAVCWPPVVREVRPWWLVRALAAVLPIGLLVSRFRMADDLSGDDPTLCHGHRARREARLAQLLAHEAATLADALEARTARILRFSATETAILRATAKPARVTEADPASESGR